MLTMPPIHLKPLSFFFFFILKVKLEYVVFYIVSQYFCDQVSEIFFNNFGMVFQQPSNYMFWD